MIRTKGEAGTGDVIEAVRHMQTVNAQIARASSAGALVEALDAAGYESVALSPSGGETLREIAFGDRTALLVGAEGRGLPADILARTRSARVPMAPGCDSLNVATASGIALYEARLTGGRLPRIRAE